MLQDLCAALADRSVCAFLGAGVNAGITNASGQSFPLGAALAEHLASLFLPQDTTQSDLARVAELVEFRAGRESLTGAIRKHLSSFEFGTVHSCIADLPFDSIWTTNYDTLIEQAYDAKAADSTLRLRTIVSVDDDMSLLMGDDVPYYKIHGCIELAQSDSGRLILTREDYRTFERRRRPLFARLRHNIQTKRFVFIGYSLQDPNFLAILDDCHHELGTLSLPHSYALIRSFSTMEADYWKSKYNVTLLSMTSGEFAVQLRDTWLASGYSQHSAAERHEALYFAADEDARFARAGSSFFVVSRDGCSGPNRVQAFYRGAPPTWADIRDTIPIEREQGWDFLEALGPELEGESIKSSVYLITGAAGTGKSTLARWLLWTALSSWDTLVVQHIPGTPLDTAPLRPLFDETMKRACVYVSDVASQVDRVEAFIHEIRQAKLPVTLVLEERSALWATIAEGRLQRYLTGATELTRLVDGEVDALLDQLEKYDCLGQLKLLDFESRKRMLEERSDKELLVALREVTESSNFDEIVRNEFRQVLGHSARDAYAIVAAASQAGSYLRLEVLSRALAVPFAELPESVLKPTTGVLSTESHGGSVHNVGVRVRARHPTIASIVFDEAAPDDSKKLNIWDLLLKNLDPGFSEDRLLLNAVALHRRMAESLVSPSAKRAIFDRLEELSPENAAIPQHRSILERELRDAAAAISFAQRALRMKPKDPSIRNTLGMAYELAARTERDATRRDRLRSEAAAIFDEGIVSDPQNPYGYLGKLALLKQDRECAELAVAALIQADILELLEDAAERTNSSPQILSALSTERSGDSDLDTLKGALRTAHRANPDNIRIVEQYAEILIRAGETATAIDQLRAAAKQDPGAWRTQLLLARALQRAGSSPVEIKAAFQQAIRNKKSEANLVIEYAAYLFTTEAYDKAEEQFEIAKRIETQAGRRGRRIPWTDRVNVTRRFEGKIVDIRGAVGFVLSIPENFKARFWRGSPRDATLRQGERVQFRVDFTAYGAEAKVSHARVK